MAKSKRWLCYSHTYLKKTAKTLLMYHKKFPILLVLFM